MAHSLEARSPFLDRKLMELATRLPTRWKVKGWQTKRIARELFADLLPEAVRERSKTGFGLPLGIWFQGPLYGAAVDLLLGPDARLRSYLRPDQVARLIDENRCGQADNGKRIWALLNLEVWLRQYETNHVPNV